eukprot:Rhum_TRINITY_DN4431_c0_g1::Rhum_TRINITY_DN4431_c0_g1_i1::g.14198::m.14198
MPRAVGDGGGQGQLDVVRTPLLDVHHVVAREDVETPSRLVEDGQAVHLVVDERRQYLVHTLLQRAARRRRRVHADAQVLHTVAEEVVPLRRLDLVQPLHNRAQHRRQPHGRDHLARVRQDWQPLDLVRLQQLEGNEEVVVEACGHEPRRGALPLLPTAHLVEGAPLAYGLVLQLHDGLAALPRPQEDVDVVRHRHDADVLAHLRVPEDPKRHLVLQGRDERDAQRERDVDHNDLRRRGHGVVAVLRAEELHHARRQRLLDLLACCGIGGKVPLCASAGTRVFEFDALVVDGYDVFNAAQIRATSQGEGTGSLLQTIRALAAGSTPTPHRDRNRPSFHAGDTMQGRHSGFAFPPPHTPTHRPQQQPRVCLPL